MAEDQDRASRIAELKQQNPRLTWARIAEETGVKERSAIKWQKTGALKPENAERLAELFGVDFDYIWIGPRPDTPDMFVDRRNSPSTPVAVNRLDGDLETRITAIEQTLADMTAMLRQAVREANEDRELAGTERDEIAELARQAVATLAEQTDLLRDMQAATRHAHDAADRLDDAVAQAATALRSAPPKPRRAASKTAPKRTPRASS